MKNLITKIINRINESTDPNIAHAWAQVLESVARSHGGVINLLSVDECEVFGSNCEKLPDAIVGHVRTKRKMGATLPSDTSQLIKEVVARSGLESEISAGAHNFAEDVV